MRNLWFAFALLSVAVCLAPSHSRVGAQEEPGVIFKTSGGGASMTPAEPSEAIAFKALRAERTRIDQDGAVARFALKRAQDQLAEQELREKRHVADCRAVCDPIRKRLGVADVAPVMLDESGDKPVFRDVIEKAK